MEEQAGRAECEDGYPSKLGHSNYEVERDAERPTTVSATRRENSCGHLIVELMFRGTSRRLKQVSEVDVRV